MRHDTAYRGYLIRQTLTGLFFIEKGGFLIQWVADADAARRVIDAILGD